MAFRLSLDDTRYTFLWSDVIPSLKSSEHMSRMLQEAVTNINLRYIVLIIYLDLLPPPNIMRERFRNHLNTSGTELDSNMQVHQIDVTEEGATEVVIMEGYRGTREGTVATERIGGPISEDWSGLPIYLQSSKTNPLGFYAIFTSGSK